MDVVIALLRVIGLLSIPAVHIIWIVALVTYDPSTTLCNSDCDTCPFPPCEDRVGFTENNNNERN